MIFNKVEKISFAEFKKINTVQTSEMFIALMRALHVNLPCTRNFFHMKRNYKNKMESGSDSPFNAKKIASIASPKMAGRATGAVDFGGFADAAKGNSSSSKVSSPKKLHSQSKMGARRGVAGSGGFGDLAVAVKSGRSGKTPGGGEMTPIVPSKADGARSSGFKISLSNTEKETKTSSAHPRKSTFGNSDALKIPSGAFKMNECESEEDS